jgi:hypothetical protein
VRERLVRSDHPEVITTGRGGELMRIRTIAAATIVAAGLTATLTGVASASTPAAPPPGGGMIIRCEDGKPVTRELTDEDRERIREMRERAGEPREGGRVTFHGEPGADGKRIKIIQGERGEHRSPEEMCAARPAH